MKIDPYKHKERFLKWKEKTKNGIPDISKENSDLILRYLYDMENGVNISIINVKGARSYIRLNTLKERIIFLSKLVKEKYQLNKLTDISEENLGRLFAEMKNGTIKRKDGKDYQSVADFIKCFKAFYHWYQKICKKQGIETQDITLDLDTKYDKPKWVYLTEEQVKLLCENATFEYKVLIMFLFDSGIRSPTELVNVKISDLFNEYKELNIREEVSKTFGRRIKLMICPELLKEYIKAKTLKPENYLFEIKPYIVNRYLKRLGQRIFGDKESPAGQKYSELTMYDFRHISCCYWLPRYKSESALKFRFGWKKSEKIHYYSEMLGMRDTIKEEDLLVDITKTEIEKEMNRIGRENELLKDRVQTLEMLIKQIIEQESQAKLNAQEIERKVIEVVKEKFT